MVQTLLGKLGKSTVFSHLQIAEQKIMYQDAILLPQELSGRKTPASLSIDTLDFGCQIFMRLNIIAMSSSAP
jgi:uncharacterized glyoxalase superfamily protein PhnB